MSAKIKYEYDPCKRIPHRCWLNDDEYLSKHGSYWVNAKSPLIWLSDSTQLLLANIVDWCRLNEQTTWKGEVDV